MAIGEANKLNYAAAVAAVKAVKDEEEARLRAEQDEQNKLIQDEAAAAGLTSPPEGGELQDPVQPPDKAKGILNTVNTVDCPLCRFPLHRFPLPNP